MSGVLSLSGSTFCLVYATDGISKGFQVFGSRASRSGRLILARDTGRAFDHTNHHQSTNVTEVWPKCKRPSVLCADLEDSDL